MNKKTPVVPKELLSWLEEHFQDKCPDPLMSDREVWMSVGSARVIRKLRDIYEGQLKQQLGG